ncbi:MAG: HEAT repeat domain-containing protein [Myxococcales bacterium]|nr:HEAT repeat domain-containing protein [Polyangiaceae bacterium]MDW8249317.1 HEAT repeat domain-containing protein [Myxococcales bacterium]
MLFWVLLLGGCKPAPQPTPQPQASASSPSGAVVEARIAALRAAEDRRDTTAIVEADLGNPEVRIRRAAARALARIASDEARAGLLRLLSDEDGEVIAFAAYGLGWTCREHEEQHTRALIARSLTLPRPLQAAPLEPWTALARAMGRCGLPEVEPTLVAWLKVPHLREAAALALGDMAMRRGLQEDTLVALTQAASEGVGEALYTFGRVDPPSEAVAARVREVAIRRLAVDDPNRIFAVRALGRCGEAAVPELRRVITGSFQDAERAEAVRALARLGEAGQRALAEVLPGLLPLRGPEGLASLVSDSYGVLTTLLSELKSPTRARNALYELARYPLPADDAPAAIRRRAVKLRCAAARLAAPRPEAPLLLGCDPAQTSTERDLARLAVLYREGIRPTVRLAVLRELVKSPDARVRGEALEALGAFKELEDVVPLLIQGLQAPHPGTVAAAAKAIAARPEPGLPSLEAALLAALARPWKPDEVETTAALLRAAGALRLVQARPYLERYCTGSSPTLRANAQGALALLGDKKTRCLNTAPLKEPAPELSRPPPTVRLVLDTDAGELTLWVDPSQAPTAATRLVELAESGFYDDMAIHRVVSGFVVQFGDRNGDGTGGAGRDTLRCETSPVPFTPLSVGVALDGRDTGSSQFFVTLVRAPHLDGEYAWVGTASGDWAAVTEGDRIRTVRVVR